MGPTSYARYTAEAKLRLLMPQLKYMKEKEKLGLR